MSHTIFRTSQDLTALHFDVADHCLVATDGRAPQSLCEEREPGTLVPFLSLLLDIAVSADAGHAS